MMESVSVRELKLRLNRYLEQVKQGKEILITERGREIARLVPLSAEQQWLVSMVRSGKTRGRGGNPQGCRGIRMKGEELAQTVSQEREEGW